MSRAFKPTEQRYSAYERELVVVTYYFIKWRHYLEGCPRGVTVVTDHKPLTLLMDQQVLYLLDSTWPLPVNSTKIKYLPGKASVAANALRRSRPPREQDQESQQHKMEAAQAVKEDAT